ncbi:uncharacterized protein LOC129797976 [Phlebotomus papatasi]|uniref:uncharacterized protein LOC129797976 n=1 Tax=Phlebotomus papatasi TaxID=29031 RepID=UPI002484452F|nr:uncharacterized protein LOC129797976 [Phlebotomus papatasi]
MEQILNRKRSREEEDASMDFMPLSKRINNLHLTAQTLPQIYDSNSSNSDAMCTQNYSQTANFCPENPSAATASFFSIPKPMEMRQEDLPHPLHLTEYCPELSILENPHYFLKNKLLFELHHQRLKRFQCFNL